MQITRLIAQVVRLKAEIHCKDQSQEFENGCKYVLKTLQEEIIKREQEAKDV